MAEREVGQSWRKWRRGREPGLSCGSVGAGFNREQETPVWLLVLGAKNPNGRVAATNEGDAVSGVCWPGLRGER